MLGEKYISQIFIHLISNLNLIQKIKNTLEYLLEL